MDELTQLSLEAACGNRAAADYLVQIVAALHLWDDLIDKDQPVSDIRINTVFTNLLTELPRNPFFSQHASILTPVTLMAIQNWHVATRAERQEVPGGITPEVAFILRSSYVDIVGLVATLCGGYEHGIDVATRVRVLAHSEGLPAYLTNLANEKHARSKE
jgi:hypothetical protein